MDSGIVDAVLALLLGLALGVAMIGLIFIL